MKYKNIASAIHNHGHSFLSSMNYVDGAHVVDEIYRIRSLGYDIEIDWISGRWICDKAPTERIQKSISYWKAHLTKHLQSQNVEYDKLSRLILVIPASGRKYMAATDDRGRGHKIYVQETK